MWGRWKVRNFAAEKSIKVKMKKKIMMAGLVLAAMMPAAANNGGTEEIVSGKGVETVAADTSRVQDLDEVVVVSQAKEFFNLRQQPISNTMFSSKEASRLGVRDLSDLSQLVPSFTMPRYGSRYTSSMYVRGIGSRVNSPAVGMYVDGLPLMNKSQFNTHLYQLDRVDILRGPQGTLYGLNTEGGMVRMYSRNPMTYQGSDVRLGFGTKMYRNAEFAHYNKLSEHFGFSLAGFYEGQNGFFKNQFDGQRADRYNEAGGKLRLMAQPSESLLFDFIADYQWVRQNGFPYGQMDTSTGCTAQPNTNLQGNYHRNILNTGLNIRWNAGAVSLHSTTSYQFLRDYMLMDIDYLPVDYMHMEQNQLQNALTEELTLKSNTQGRWKWATGLFGSYQWLKTDAPVHFDNDMDNFLTNTINTAMYNAMVNSMKGRFLQQGMDEAQAIEMAKSTIERAGGVHMNVDMATVPGLFYTPQANLGVFHESNIDLTDHLTATLGLRYDYTHVSIDYNTSAQMTSVANVMGQEATVVLTSALVNHAHNHFDQLLPKFGLTYRLHGGSNIYATVSKGYRAGGYNIQMFSDILQTELNANSSQRGNYDIPHDEQTFDNIRNTIAYKPETSWNYEVGTHLNLFSNRVQFDLAAFFMQIRNQQLSVMAGTYGFGRMMTNAGKSFSCGLEASLRGEAADNHLSWALNYGLTHAEFKEYIYNKAPQGSERMDLDYNGNRVPFIPMHTLGGMGDYRFDLRGAMKSLTLGANFSAQGSIYWDEANLTKQKFYGILGAHADADFGLCQLSLWVRNLTDTRYNTFAVSTSATGSELYFAQRGNPIQCGLDLKFHF